MSREDYVAPRVSTTDKKREALKVPQNNNNNKVNINNVKRNVHVCQVLVDWAPVPAVSIPELVGNGLTSIVLDANRPEDADDSAALIRTLRPIKEVC